MRRILNLIARRDPRTGRMSIEVDSQESIELSSDGSLESVRVRHERFYHCGCGAAMPPGGRCHRCSGLSCIRCHGHCLVCAMPACLECSRPVRVAGGHMLRICHTCQDALRRDTTRRRVIRVLLSPFVEFKDPHGRSR